MSQQLLFPMSDELVADRPVNVSSIPQRSPFRYPGGKTWLVPVLRKWLTSHESRPEVLVEPFAGGAIIGLTAAFEQLVHHVVLGEIDAQVGAVWRIIFEGQAEWLAHRIISFELSFESLQNELSQPANSLCELAFQTILRNRTTRGGILAEGAGFIKTGEGNRGVASRWYPRTLARRIHDISQVSERLTFIHGDAFDLFAEYRNNPDAVFFLDPPYTAGGKRAGSRLYSHSEIDHDRLFRECQGLAGDFLMTYDNTPEVIDLACRHGLITRLIAMKNTHHAEMKELLIGKNLDWLD